VYITCLNRVTVNSFHSVKPGLATGVPDVALETAGAGTAAGSGRHWQIKRSSRARSLSDPRLTALVVHGERCGARRRFLARPFPQCCQERLNSLPTVQFAFPVLMESSSIAISF
jgi:hypothetical protein